MSDRIPNSNRLVELRLPPGTHFMKNGGKMTYVSAAVRHRTVDGQCETTVVAKLYGNRHLTNGGADHFLRPVRVIDGIICVIGEAALTPITAVQAAECETELREVQV